MPCSGVKKRWSWRACLPIRWHSRLQVQVKDLSGQNYIHFDRNLVIRRQVDRFQGEGGPRVEIVLEVRQHIEKYQTGGGHRRRRGLVARAHVARGSESRHSGGIAPLRFIAPLRRPLGIIQHRRRPRLSAAASRFLDILWRITGNHRPKRALGTFAAGTPAYGRRQRRPTRSQWNGRYEQIG